MMQAPPELPSPGVLDCFERTACEAPDRIALRAGERRIGYGELSRRADTLARRLRAAGAGPGERVALLLPRSPEAIIALLAILKTGAAYVPVDPDFPADWCQRVLAHCRPRLAVADAASIAHLAPGLPWLAVDDAAPDGMDTEPLPAPDPQSPMYLIFTSGSSGEPKGVLVSHANVARLLPAVGSALPLPRQAVWTQLHSLSFGFSVWEIWGALASGGCLLLVPSPLLMAPQRFWPWLVAHDAGVLSLTPSAFRLLTQASDILPDLPALRLLAFSGEPLDTLPLRRWFDRFGTQGPQLVNMYALTETAGEVSLARVDAGSAADPSGIGMPLPDTELLLLDSAGRPVPDGEAGELYIGGPMVALGYFEAPTEQAARFVVDPLGDGCGRRYYRSGDLARRREDGSYAFVGRADRQLKIRGYRVEPAVVEQALMAENGLRDAIAAALPGPDGEAMLTAFVITDTAGVDASALLQRLATRLPHYLVPERIVAVERFPLTPNGKLDLTALQGGLSGRHDPAPAPPPGDDRARLAAIWCDLLGCDSIGDDDDFFDCGGYSLLALQLTLKVEQQLGVAITIRDLFEQPRFAGLLSRIADLRRPDSAAVILPEPVFAPAQAEDEAPMRLAIAEARAAIGRGQPPYAACVVKDGRVIACVHNAIWSKTDATAHAEIEAIREACRVLGSIDLAGCTVYSTCEPCSMCYSACVWAGVERIVYGVRMEDEERYGIARRTVPAAQMQALMGRPQALVHDFLREEMIEVFEQWVGLQSMLR